MKVCVVGGLNRMEKDYVKAYKDIGCKAKVFNKLNNNFEQSIKCTECVVLLTKLASHNMANKAKKPVQKSTIYLLSVPIKPARVPCAV